MTTKLSDSIMKADDFLTDCSHGAGAVIGVVLVVAGFLSFIVAVLGGGGMAVLIGLGLLLGGAGAIGDSRSYFQAKEEAKEKIRTALYNAALVKKHEAKAAAEQAYFAALTVEQLEQKVVELTKTFKQSAYEFARDMRGISAHPRLYPFGTELHKHLMLLLSRTEGMDENTAHSTAWNAIDKIKADCDASYKAEQKRQAEEAQQRANEVTLRLNAMCQKVEG